LALAQRAPEEPVVIHVSGVVHDAETKQPIERFVVIPGTGTTTEYSLRGHKQVIGADGDYEVEVEHMPGVKRGVSMSVICIEADGYAAQIISVPTAEDKVKLDVELNRAPNITGKVVGTDGQPAASAQVARFTRGFSFRIENGMLPQDADVPRAVTDAGGHFSLRPAPGEYSLVIIDDSGFVEVPKGKHDPQKPIVIQPWGRIEGRVMSGGEPVPEVQLAVRNAGEGPSTWSGATSDANGAFVIERVIPGPARVSRLIEMPPNGVLVETQSVETDVKAGQASHVQIGGRGRPVVGRALVPDGLPEPWRADFAMLIPIRDNKPGMHWHHAAPVEEDGYFEFADVEGGTYALHVQFYSGEGQHRVMQGIAAKQFDVPPIPDGHSDEPVDLGEIAVEPVKQQHRIMPRRRS
jgi:hypothetical protein